MAIYLKNQVRLPKMIVDLLHKCDGLHPTTNGATDLRNRQSKCASTGAKVRRTSDFRKRSIIIPWLPKSKPYTAFLLACLSRVLLASYRFLGSEYSPQRFDIFRETLYTKVRFQQSGLIQEEQWPLNFNLLCARDQLSERFFRSKATSLPSGAMQAIRSRSMMAKSRAAMPA